MRQPAWVGIPARQTWRADAASGFVPCRTRQQYSWDAFRGDRSREGGRGDRSRTRSEGKVG